LTIATEPARQFALRPVAKGRANSAASQASPRQVRSSVEQASTKAEVAAFDKYGKWTCERYPRHDFIGRMIKYGQFCPVAKSAEIFGGRWSPLIIRELCHGARTFGDLLVALPLISRTMLAQRLKELTLVGVIQSNAKEKGRGHLYKLTPAGEDFQPLIVLMSEWGRRWGQGLIGPDDLDPKLLVWGLRQQIDLADIPRRGFILRFDFSGIPKGNRSLRYWWLLIRQDDIEVCLKDPGPDVDVVIDADLGAFTKVWLGYAGLREALASGHIKLHGSSRAIAETRRMLKLSDGPARKTFAYPLSAAPMARTEQVGRGDAGRVRAG
jgi:DNA-binding HxlR family transcriptional regulator